MSELIQNQNHLPGHVQDLKEKTKKYISNSKSENTKKAYRKDWQHFVSWCNEKSFPFLPTTAEIVCLYLSDLADKYKAATIQRRLVAISQAHKMAGYESPTTSQQVRDTFSGIKREIGTRQDGKAPAVIEDIRLMLEQLPDNLLGLRDHSLLLIGFVGGFRRSELVALDVEDITFSYEGMKILIRKSKTDQEKQGRTIGVPYGSDPKTCPVRSLMKWLEASGIKSGPLFVGINRHGHMSNKRLSSHAVALVVKRYAEKAGLDPSVYSGHSLRSGLVTTAHKAGKSEHAIMKQTGHKSLTMVRRYIRDADVFNDNAATGIGL